MLIVAQKLQSASEFLAMETKAMHGAHLLKTSRPDERVRHPRRDAETFWTETEKRPETQLRDRDETETKPHITLIDENKLRRGRRISLEIWRRLPGDRLQTILFIQGAHGNYQWSLQH